MCGGGTRKQRVRECGKRRDLSVGRKLRVGGYVGSGGMSGRDIHGVSRDENGAFGIILSKHNGKRHIPHEFVTAITENRF